MRQTLIGKKSIGILLSAVLLLQCAGFTAPAAAAADSATATGVATVGDAAIDYRQQLTDNGDGTFTLALTLDANTVYTDKSTDPDVSRNGYFSASRGGEYLVEVWGGNGADGTDSTANGGGKGGSGGAGGYVCGVISLQAGETLFYQLGGHGKQTVNTDEGGGINGDGGNAGSITMYTVGGGGGYSAVYKFAAGQFQRTYLDANGTYDGAMISEADRLSTYLMVAAGGGGGGHGSGGLLSSDAGNPPNGGAGGNMDSTAIELTGLGTVYIGADGSSSGSDFSYVGRGGSNVPGGDNATFIGLVTTQPANDWAGTANTNTTPGSGGSSNLRGGAGGAGYCGGGGGVMTSLVVPTNVGGGGGGSSFVAQSVRDYSGTPSVENPNDNLGGAIRITSLNQDAFDYLGDVAVSYTATDYFTCTPDLTGDAVKENGKLDLTQGAATLNLTFTPKADFVGGNAVPLLKDGTLTLTCGNGGKTCDIALAADCAAVNVPLRFEVEVGNHSANTTGKSYQISSLHGENPTATTPNWDYAAPGEYAVDTSHDPSYDKNAGTVTPTETTAYPVSITLTPKKSPAAVGAAVTATTFTQNAYIYIQKLSSDTLNGNIINYSKALSYRNGVYTLALTGSITSDISKVKLDPHKVTNPTDNGTYIAQYDGWYLLQAWGGAGGKGGDSYTQGNLGGAGGAGGYVSGLIYLKKGETLAYTVGQNGADGDKNPAIPSWVTAAANNGKGGGYSAIKDKNGDYLLIAGGGGGGGHSGTYYDGVAEGNGEPGKSGEGNAGASSEFGTIPDSYKGKQDQSELTLVSTSDGLFGVKREQYAPGKGGEAGANYRNTEVYATGNETLLDDLPALSEDSKQAVQTAWTGASHPAGENPAAGAVVITPLDVYPEGSETSAAPIQDYVLDTQLSKYFTLNGTAESSIRVYEDADNRQETPWTVSYTDQIISVSGINPTVTKTESNTVDDKRNPITKTHSSAEFRVEIDLKPKDGFLGGNDVPVLEQNPTDAGMPMRMRFTQSGQSGVLKIANDPAADYANVPISESLTWTITPGTEEERTITQGEGNQYVPRVKLYTVTGTTQLSGYPWEADFVEYTETLTETSTGAVVADDNIEPDPLATTPYTVTAGLKPKKEQPVNAIVTDPATAVTVSVDTEIIVLPRVHYMLTNMTADDVLDTGTYADGYATIRPGEQYTAKLSADRGYQLPESISVTYAADGSAVQGYTYDSASGQLVIPAQAVTGTIVITAAATEKEYYIYYHYQSSPQATELGEKQDGSFKAGQTVTPEYPGYTVYDGYDFVWDWGEYAPQNATSVTMPAQDLHVTGTYVPKEYTLAIHYYEQGSTKPLKDDAIVTVRYGESYNVTSPVVTGYVADRTVVTGTMTAGDKEEIVYYTPTTNTLTIIYQKRDPDGTITELSRVSGTKATGEAYSVSSPGVKGYSPDRAVVEGTMTATGVVEYVVYEPNAYTVTFNPAGGTVSPTTRQAVYGQPYSYQPDGTYSDLPTPVRPGYTFRGWFSGDKKIAAKTIYNTEGNVTLTAQWEAVTYKLTIMYQYEDGTQAHESHTETLTAGETYSVTSPAIEHYAPDKDVVSGTMPQSSVTVIVIYRSTVHTLTIEYRYADTEALVSIDDLGELQANPVSYSYSENTSYNHPSPQLNGYTAVPGTVEGTMGTQDVSVTVRYTKEKPVISVTVEWGTLEFVYEYGAWDPQTHTYNADTVTPKVNQGNYIQVTNNEDSNIGVTVALAYNPNEAYKSVTGYFTDKAWQYAAGTDRGTLPVGAKQKYYLWLDGTLERGKKGTEISGTCVVTITGGG